MAVDIMIISSSRYSAIEMKKERQKEGEKARVCMCVWEREKEVGKERANT